MSLKSKQYTEHKLIALFFAAIIHWPNAGVIFGQYLIIFGQYLGIFGQYLGVAIIFALTFSVPVFEVKVSTCIYSYVYLSPSIGG